MRESVRIPLRVMHAGQHAALAALVLCVAWAGLTLSGSLRGSPDGRDALASATRAYTAEIDSALEDVVGDAKVLSLLLGPRAAVDQNSRSLQNWLRLNPMFVDVAHVSADGVVQAAADRRRVGRSIAGQPWFRRARSAEIVITSAPRETGGVFDLVTTMGNGTDERILLRVSSVFFQNIDRRVRTEHGVPRDILFIVSGADGARLAGSAQAPEKLGAKTAPAYSSVGNHAPTGWSISSQSTTPPPSHGLPGMTALAAGLAMVLGAALIGWLFGDKMARSLARLARRDRKADERRASRIQEVAEMLDEVETRQESEESHARHAGRAIERMKQRLRTFENMSGWTCWEIDIETRQVVWTDPRSAEGAASDRVIDLDDLAERIDFADRDLFHRAIASAAKSDSSHDVSLRLQDRDDDLGNQLLVRFVGAGEAGPGMRRIFAVSRRITAVVATGAEPRIAARRPEAPAHVLTQGVVHDFNDALSTVLSNLGVLMRKRLAREETELVARAFAGAERGAAVTSRLLGLIEKPSDVVRETDLAETARAILSPTFIDANLLPEIRIIDRIPDGLPKLRCGETLLEVLLLNVALYVHECGLGDLGISATREDPEGHPSRDDRVRILFASGRPKGADRVASSTSRLEAIASIIEAMGGTWHVVSDGTDGRAFLAEIWLAAAEQSFEEETLPLCLPLDLLVVGSDAPARRGLTQTLRDLGHSVARASSGEETETLLEQNPAYDAVVFERSLPVMSELQLAVTIMQRHPRMRVILAGPDGHLSPSACEFLGLAKPFRRETPPASGDESAARVA